MDEVLIVDPEARRVTWLTRDGAGYAEAEGGALLGITTAELASQIDWPPVSLSQDSPAQTRMKISIVSP